MPSSSDSKASQSVPFIKRLSKRTLIIISAAIISILLIVAIILDTSSSKTLKSDQIDSQNKTGLENENGYYSPDSDNSKPSKALALNTLIYGAWKGNESVITAFDIDSSKATVLAELPQDIKKVSIISPQEIIYIDKTDSRDHGKQIVRYNLKSKSAKVIAKADPDFGIDDYVLSPNKKYIAIWSVSFAKGSNILQGGRSRVYAYEINSTEAHKLFDETATPDRPVHYPLAVVDDGRVFTDQFMPNDSAGGAGWAYGMSVSESDGSENKDLDNMGKGTYGTQPYPSNDGKYLVFGGYDGSKGPGDSINSNVRQAILTPNTVEILDTTTLKRQKMPNLPNTNIYSTVNWGSNSNDVIVTVLSEDIDQTGFFVYSRAKGALSEINLPERNDKYFAYVSQLSGNGILMGVPDESLTSTANLGESYLPSLTQVYAQKNGSQNAELLPLEDALVQYITVLPSNYFQGVLGATTTDDKSFNPQPTIIDSPVDPYGTQRKNLQLRTFNLPKQDLSIKRQEQQSKPLPTTPPKEVTKTPKPTSPAYRLAFPTKPPTFVMDDCTELAEAQCSAGFGKPKDPSPAFRNCVKTNKEKNRATIGTPNAVCSRSPLYLYGEAGQVVKVKVLTTVYNDVPSQKGLYNATLLPDGLMQIENQKFDSIDYDYKPNLRRLAAPTKGTVTKKDNLEKVLTTYAKKLSLNKKETEDLVKFGLKNIKSSYVFVSFFDQITSEQILPLSFTPKPDNYLNVVFYFKQIDEKPNYTPIPPVFPKPLNRTGTTAVEVSEIVE